MEDFCCKDCLTFGPNITSSFIIEPSQDKLKATAQNGCELVALTHVLYVGGGSPLLIVTAV